MKKNYDHIIKMENIMVSQENNVKALENLLKKIDLELEEYETLYTYYFSEQRVLDLEDDENHLIPEDIKRGVLSEDEVYNLFLDSNDVAIHMMETALKILKTK